MPYSFGRVRTSPQDLRCFAGSGCAGPPLRAAGGRAGCAAPKTINRRISSISSFHKYLAAAAAEMRLPITVPNPAHAQFISRESTDPRDTPRRGARQLMGMTRRGFGHRFPRSRHC